MHIEFPSSEEFNIKPFSFHGEMMYLVNPNHIGAKWTRDNLIFRSSVWTPEGLPVSLGLPKFFNYHEHPELSAPPKSLKGCELVEKLDGSCLIVSLYKGNLMIRTRGTTDAKTMKNGSEIEYFKTKYPRAFDLANRLTVRDGTADHSLIFEWVTLSNKIVINYGAEPDIYLTGIINHNDYSLLSQKSVDEFANIIHVKRPKRYQFDSLEQFLADINVMQGKEGVVMYYNSGQEMRKVKTEWYNYWHSMRSNLTTDKLIDFYFMWLEPDYQEYMAKFSKDSDYETQQWAMGAISALYDGVREYKKIMNHMQEKVALRKEWNRKDFAIAAKQEYGDTKKFSIAMSLYLGTPIKPEIRKHLLLQNTKQMELGMFKPLEVKEEEL